MSDLFGTVSAPFEPVYEAVADNIGRGVEVGLSLAVDVDGDRVVDLWGGHRDPARTQPWTRDTVTNVWSLSKCVTSLAALRLVDAGELDVYAPVSRYWPEFACCGKQAVEVRHVLSHTSGVSGLDQPAQLEDLYDTRAAAARMAQQRPWWQPGSASGYHVLNYGHLIGELVSRITGMSLGQFVAHHIAGLMHADFQFGLTCADVNRVADVIVPGGSTPAPDPHSVAGKTLSGPPFCADAANSAPWRAAELGAANGHGTAAALCDMMAPLARGGAAEFGQVLSPATIDLIFDEQSCGVDLVNGLHLRWGIGYALSDRRTLAWIPEGRVAFWGGWGGSMLIVDLDRKITISYVMNRMGSDLLGSSRAAAYVTALYRALTGARS
ncbi:beta-lactamase family protein [Mycolicibacterium sp. 018/SC-01/001]|uniref:serine hydrolase domain-containing protein n=1 Tax=Mycolicibacterium sp. 018/SC-01/001 TaxID=2592069 RepID=UPI00117D05AF|nr:serine hydrolase domain-containing protein [Mycolicibacterium sp. 018/SC-01/001]TRW89137.1 beta-lactamase family protein [Mycolicibacterium sp. 018/SC-01/001]